MNRFPFWGLAALMICLVFGLAACEFQTDGMPPLPGNTPTETPSADSIEVFFTDPTRSDASRFRGGPDVQIAASINAARLSVDVAIHELNLWSIRDALIAAHKRGVRVRVVAESDNFDYEEFGELKDAGIPVLGDRSEGLMHNKFIVVDNLEVWTGSVNFTTTDMYFNNNNLLHIRSAALAENYTREFEEMFIEDHFGSAPGADTPNPSLVIAGVPVVNLFSPDDGAEQAIIARLAAAETSVYFLAFSFTSDPIANALLARLRDGVTIAGVMEEAQVNSNAGSEYERLRLEGVDVRLDGNQRNMHHKVFIIDERTVIAGSYNFTASASRFNDENVLIIEDPVLAGLYLDEFNKVFAQSSP